MAKDVFETRKTVDEKMFAMIEGFQAASRPNMVWVYKKA